MATQDDNEINASAEQVKDYYISSITDSFFPVIWLSKNKHYLFSNVTFY